MKALNPAGFSRGGVCIRQQPACWKEWVGNVPKCAAGCTGWQFIKLKVEKGALHENVDGREANHWGRNEQESSPQVRAKVAFFARIYAIQTFGSSLIENPISWVGATWILEWILLDKRLLSKCKPPHHLNRGLAVGGCSTLVLGYGCILKTLDPFWYRRHSNQAVLMSGRGSGKSARMIMKGI